MLNPLDNIRTFILDNKLIHSNIKINNTKLVLLNAVAYSQVYEMVRGV